MNDILLCSKGNPWNLWCSGSTSSDCIPCTQQPCRYHLISGLLCKNHQDGVSCPCHFMGEETELQKVNKTSLRENGFWLPLTTIYHDPVARTLPIWSCPLQPVISHSPIPPQGVELIWVITRNKGSSWWWLSAFYVPDVMVNIDRLM